MKRSNFNFNLATVKQNLTDNKTLTKKAKKVLKHV